MNCNICENKVYKNERKCKICGYYLGVNQPSFFSKLLLKKNSEICNLEMEIAKIDTFLRLKHKVSLPVSFFSKKEWSKLFEEYYGLYYKVIDWKRQNQIEKIAIQNNYNSYNIEQFLITYSNIESIRSSINEKFVINEKNDKEIYLDQMLNSVDINIKLDEEQRDAVVIDEDYCLIIAGAGAGKTTTIAAKVKYLIDHKNIMPEEILIISFTNKAVDELRERINDRLGIPCPITTFHKTGNAILRKVEPDRLRVISSNYGIIIKFLSEYVFEHIPLLKKLVLFFGYYLDVPDLIFEFDSLEKYYEYIERNEFSTFKGNLGDYNEEILDSRSKKKLTINNELLRSAQEVQIANFLYMNQLDYVYEKPYPHKIKDSKKIYTPDFFIKQGRLECYIEHFGISEDGKSSMFHEDMLSTYKSNIRDKISHHRTHNTNLIYTYSMYNDKRSTIEHLQEQLERKGFVLNRRSEEEVYEKIKKSENAKYIDKFAILASNFLRNYKTMGYGTDGFSILRDKTKNVRDLLFIDIIEEIYKHYHKELVRIGAVDYEDMITESARYLKEVKELGNKLPFKYIFVDEYQDISQQRFNLAKTLSEVTDAKIVAVGDDWQSIFAFSGSDITLFTEFKKQMGYAAELKITHTYRNAQELIDIAGDFIQRNETQIKKSLISPKSIQKPIVIFTYCNDYKKNAIPGVKGVLHEKAKVISDVIDKIVQVHGKKKSILLLGRYGFDGERLGQTEFFSYSEGFITCHSQPDVGVHFLTTHSSKGLGYDNVIIINAEHGVYGFPCQIEDDPVMRFVIKEDKGISFSEERRLFYVAMTRTKNRVFIVAPEKNPSSFVVELIENYENITVHGELSKQLTEIKKDRRYCPVCGFPLQLRVNKAYGLRLYICTNEPELCDFMTNDIRGNGNIYCCDLCDGYMIVKKKKDKNQFFLGCTNYKDNGTGCNNAVPINNNDI